MRGGSASIVSDPSILSSIRLIDFKKFSELGCCPRFPENADLVITADQFTPETFNQSLIVFISHCWLRGSPTSEGWDGRPHPDTVEHGKHKLCVEGIQQVWSILAPGMTDCYVWIDYGCIDQDGDPAGELKQLDLIIQLCDVMFTPIFDKDPKAWDFPKTIHNYYDDYKSPSWNDSHLSASYLHRGWCRVEMFYAVNIPLLTDSEERRSKFTKGLLFHRSGGRRPHILYGSKEQSTKGAPKLLPPLSNSFFEKYHPEKGLVSKPSDTAIIQRLVQELLPFMKTVAEGYSGETKDGQPHGKGRYIYGNGDLYEGEFKDGKISGKGKFTFANGHMYDGEWVLGKRQGHGTFLYANGNVYIGQYKENKRHGKGRYDYANGDRYEGEYKIDVMSGHGVYSYSNGDRYEGNFQSDQKNGKGKYTYHNGNVYEGDWKDGKRHGKGKLTYANNDCYEGDFVNGVREGRGKFVIANSGDVYEGGFHEDRMHGKARYLHKTSQDRFEGEYKEGKRNGKGKITHSDGTSEEVEYSEGVIVNEKKKK